MVLRLPESWSNWNLEMFVFEEREKPECPEKNLSEQRRESTTNFTHIWHLRQDLNPGRIGGRRALSLLRHPLLPELIRLRTRSRAEEGKAWSEGENGERDWGKTRKIRVFFVFFITLGAHAPCAKIPRQRFEQ